MATLPVSVSSRAGADVTALAQAADAGGSDKWPNTGKELLVIVNGNVAAYTATFPLPALVDGQAVASRTVTVPAGHTAVVGPFPPLQYNDGQSNATVQHSLTASVKLLPVLPGN